jgi:hypothetical protein
MSEFTHLHPASLTISPLLDRILMLSAVDTDDTRAEFAAGLLSVTKSGKIRVPLQVIDGTTEVVDGRHRLAWALEAGLATVPVEYVCAADAMEIIRSEIFARRSMSKGQKAWLHLWLVPTVANASTSCKKGSDIECPSLEDAAHAAGVSRSLMKEAAALYRIFTTDKRFTTSKNAAAARAAVEERIWSGEGLGQILADLRPSPNSLKPATAPVDAITAADAEAARVSDKYSDMLAEWETELSACKSWAHLTPLALHTTTTSLCTHTTTMALAAMARPDLPAAQKSHILAELRESLATATKAAQAAGLTVK